MATLVIDDLPRIAGVSVHAGDIEPLPESLACADDARLEAAWCAARIGIIPTEVANATSGDGWPARVIDFAGGVVVVVRFFDLAAVIVARGAGLADRRHEVVAALLRARPRWDEPACLAHLFEGFQPRTV